MTLQTGAFVHDVRAPRAVFGAGARHQALMEVERLGAERVLIITTAGRAAVAAATAKELGARVAGVFDSARQHVPRAILDKARALADRLDADCYLTLGGGSAVGFGKALALDTRAPIVALPTTYAGSEVTPIWGITDGDRKLTGRSDDVLPRTVIYDPELNLDLPPRVAGASGMNAVAHCVEAVYAPDASPLTVLIASEGLRVLSRALVGIAAAPADVESRSAAMYGSYLAGTSLAGATMGVHHRLCHMLGGRFGLPHAETHAVLLPHVVRHKSSTEDLSRIARAIGSNDAAGGIFQLRAAAGAPASLRELGLSLDNLERAVECATEISDGDSRLTAADARGILEPAFYGGAPAAPR